MYRSSFPPMNGGIRPIAGGGDSQTPPPDPSSSPWTGVAGNPQQTPRNWFGPMQTQGAGAAAPGGGDLSGLIQALMGGQAQGGQPASSGNPLQDALQPGYLGRPTQVDPTFFGGVPQQQAATYGGAPQGTATNATAGYQGEVAQYGGAPQGTASNAAAASQGNVAQFGGTGYGGAYQTGGANLALGNLDPALRQALDPNTTMGLIRQGLQPEFAQQQRGLSQALAEAGIVGGASVNAQDQLARQQTAAAAPALAGAIQNSQGNLLSATGTQAGLGQQTALSNQGALNSALQQYISNQQQAGLTNAGALNSANQFNAANQQQSNQFNASSQNALLSQYLQQQQQAGLANAGALNSAGQFNASNQQQNSQFNASSQNALLQMFLQQQQQAGLSNASSENAMRELFAGQQQQTGLYNAGQANESNRINAGAINATDAANMASFNGSNNNLFQAIMNGYYQQQGAGQQAILAGQGAANSLAGPYAQNFQIPTGAGAGANGLFNALGSIYQPRQAPIASGTVGDPFAPTSGLPSYSNPFPGGFQPLPGYAPGPGTAGAPYFGQP